MNKIYKVIWSKVRNCYVAVSEIAKRNGKSCTSVNCGAKANRGHAGVALAIALSLSMAGGGVAWAEDVTEQSKTIYSTDTAAATTSYILNRTGSTVDSAAGTGVTFTVENGGKVYLVTSYKSGNIIKIKEGGEVTTALRGGINNNSITVEGTAKNVAGGYIRQDTTFSGLGIMGNDVTNNTVTVKGNAVITGNELIGGNSYSGNVTKNTIVINGGTVNVTNVYGGYSSSGNAGGVDIVNGNTVTKQGNTVTISGGTVSGNVYGGYVGYVGSGSSSAQNNKVSISGTSTIGSSDKSSTIYGGRAVKNATNNTVNINLTTNGKIRGNVYGGWVNNNSPVAKDNSVTVDAGEISGDVYGGFALIGGSVEGNSVSMKGTVGGNIYGGIIRNANSDASLNKNVENNHVTITNGTGGRRSAWHSRAAS